MKFWTLKDSNGDLYVDEFRTNWGRPFTDIDAINARMEYSTMKEFFDNGFELVFVHTVETEPKHSWELYDEKEIEK